MSASSRILHDHASEGEGSTGILSSCTSEPDETEHRERLLTTLPPQILDKDGPNWTMSISQHETGNTVDIVDEHDNVCASMLLSAFMSGECQSRYALQIH